MCMYMSVIREATKADKNGKNSREETMLVYNGINSSQRMCDDIIDVNEHEGK